jgi:hypothetical protein
LVLKDAALASLKSLNKNDVVEVRAMQHPPDGVRMVVEAVCILKNVKPKKVPGERVCETSKENTCFVTLIKLIF